MLDLELGKRLGAQGLWPLAPKEWDEDTFFALVEAIGDLVARPRARYMHFYGNCGWHYSQFALTPGQALYRSEVNDLFYRAGTGLQLAARRPM